MTFLGMPAGRGNLTGDRPFPAAAHDALTDSQLRRGRGDALTWTLGAGRWALAVRLGRLLGRGRHRLPPPLSAWTASRDLPIPPKHSLRHGWQD